MKFLDYVVFLGVGSFVAIRVANKLALRLFFSASAQKKVDFIKKAEHFSSQLENQTSPNWQTSQMKQQQLVLLFEKNSQRGWQAPLIHPVSNNIYGSKIRPWSEYKLISETKILGYKYSGTLNMLVPEESILFLLEQAKDHENIQNENFDSTTTQSEISKSVEQLIRLDKEYLPDRSLFQSHLQLLQFDNESCFMLKVMNELIDQRHRFRQVQKDWTVTLPHERIRIVDIQQDKLNSDNSTSDLYFVMKDGEIFRIRNQGLKYKRPQEVVLEQILNKNIEDFDLDLKTLSHRLETKEIIEAFYWNKNDLLNIKDIANINTEGNHFELTEANSTAQRLHKEMLDILGI